MTSSFMLPSFDGLNQIPTLTAPSAFAESSMSTPPITIHAKRYFTSVIGREVRELVLADGEGTNGLG